MKRKAPKTTPTTPTARANPTTTTYTSLTEAFDFFNAELFAGELPHCLITMQRKSKAYGYFAGNRFASVSNLNQVTDEIALNPTPFRDRSTEEILSTLVHEMAHLWQHHHGKTSRNGYHNAQWAAKMTAIGLVPSSTGAPGGKETGQKVSHYIAAGGPFQAAFRKLEARGFEPLLIELWGDEKKAKKKAESKTKYTCGGCDANVWGKPGLHIVCGECEEDFICEA